MFCTKVTALLPQQGSEGSRVLSAFDVSIGNEMISFSGARVLQEPVLRYGKSSSGQQV